MTMKAIIAGHTYTLGQGDRLELSPGFAGSGHCHMLDPRDFGPVGQGDDAPAIQAAINAAGAGDVVGLRPAVYDIGSTLKIGNGAMLAGFAPNGDIFGATSIDGAILKWVGATGGTIIEFGADRMSASPMQSFGGGVANVQIDGDWQAGTLLRVAAAGNAVFENIKGHRILPGGGTGLLLTANASAPGFENTIRSCRFSNINVFAYGAADAIVCESNGLEGGATGCDFRHVMAFHGADNGAGGGLLISSMDNCRLSNVFAVRYPGGTGDCILLDGDAPSGRQVQGNILNLVRVDDGPLRAKGRYSNGNRIYGLTSVDAEPEIIIENDADLDYDLLTGGYGTIPGASKMQPIIASAKDGLSNGVARNVTVRHDLHADAASPAPGIGAGFAAEIINASGAPQVVGTIDAVATQVGAINSEWRFGVQAFGTLYPALTVRYGEVDVSAAYNNVRAVYYCGLSGADNFVSFQFGTAYSANKFQFQAKGGKFNIGLENVGDFTEWDQVGKMTHAGDMHIAGTLTIGNINALVAALRAAGMT